MEHLQFGRNKTIYKRVWSNSFFQQGTFYSKVSDTTAPYLPPNLTVSRFPLLPFVPVLEPRVRPNRGVSGALDRKLSNTQYPTDMTKVTRYSSAED